MSPANFEKLKTQALDPELPGAGQFYCVQCARYFIAEAPLTEHYRTKLHKRRVKILTNETAYTQKEAELAGGLQTDNGKKI